MTESFLSTVVRQVRADSGSSEYERGVPRTAPRQRPGFRAAIERAAGHGALVVEYKRASPGSPTPFPSPRSVEEFVGATGPADVAAYSCLATRHGFDGSPALVAELAAASGRPVLFKEFVVGPRQIEVAARTGAAAILLIARLESTGLLDAPLADLARTAHRLGLEVVLELHDSAELSRAGAVRADVYGVNVRDLATLAFDRPKAFHTIDLAVRRGLRPLLGLSGVAGPADASAFWSHGCDGILVGTAVARSARPAPLLRSLRRSPEGPS